MLRDIAKPHTDAINMVARNDAATMALLCLEPIDGSPPADMLMGVAVMLIALTTKLGVDERDILTKACRILNPADFDRKANMQLDALFDWIGIEKLRDRQREEWGLLS